MPHETPAAAYDRSVKLFDKKVRASAQPKRSIPFRDVHRAGVAAHPSAPGGFRP